MKSSTSQYLYSVLRQSMQELRHIAIKAAGILGRTPLPKILLLCVALALLLTIVPLLLTLFFVFLLVKLFFLVLFINLRQQSNSDQILRKEIHIDRR